MKKRLTKFAQVAGIMLALVFTFSCSSDKDDDNSGGGGGSTFKDDRDGKSYKYVKIGDQTWMAENLNYRGTEPDTLGKCNDDPALCKKYGRWYEWATAMVLSDNCNSNSCVSQISAKHKGICPSGWHIPSNEEWTTLETYVENDNGCTYCASKYLKAKAPDWDGEDKYGFAALKSGRGSGDGISKCENYWWSAKDDGETAYARCIRYDGEFRINTHELKDNLFSVRCVKDN